jgi:chemotaxis protein CheZ
MTARRKVFRIEELVAPRREKPKTPTRPRHDDGIVQELGALRTMIASTLPPRAGVASETETRSRVFQRIADELTATLRDSEQATQKILAAAEDIDRAADNLAATPKNVSGQGLARDIRERVTQIFEACNFQDLTSQRITKVMAVLGEVADRMAVSEKTSTDNAPPLHGPRLAGDVGHISQRDIDSFFDEDR